MDFTLNDLNNYTYYSKHYIERLRKNLEKADLDEQKDLRHKQHECQYCWYMYHPICGQGFTDYSCAICGAVNTHANTCVPRFCPDCAEKYSICHRCGGDIDLNKRRKLEKSMLVI